MTDLYQDNTFQKFWQCQPDLPVEVWNKAIQQATPFLNSGSPLINQQDILWNTLGEGRFGANHWKLSTPKRIYYLLKPILPRSITKIMRRIYGGGMKQYPENWPIDARFPEFQWELLRQLMLLTGKNSIRYTNFWPNNLNFAFVITHDIETARGQNFVRKIADLEEGLGFRSSFNFVLERYPLDMHLIQELRDRGFEVGCHGLKHDGKKFNSPGIFEKRAKRINQRIKELDISGFRSPLTHRNPEWMQMLEIEYDSSFFDTDPFEPLPGGVMSIWPFHLGHFVELPYTLPQDYTVGNVLREKTPRIWLEKIEFLKKYRALALINSHPDYLSDPVLYQVYAEFLQNMKNRSDYWHALPIEVARWWKKRTFANAEEAARIGYGNARLENEILFV